MASPQSQWGVWLLAVGVLVLVAGCSTTSSTDASAPAPGPGVSSAAPPEAAGEEAEPVDLGALQAAVEHAPNDPNARRELAIGLFKSNRRQEAVEQFERAAELQPDARSWIALANAYGFTSRFDDAKATYERVLQSEPNNAVALYNLANIEFMQANTEASIQLYQRALDVEPGYLLARFNLAQGQKLIGQDREAYQNFAQVLDGEPQNGEELQAYDNALYEMAVLDVKHGAAERAEQMFRALLDGNPDHASAHYAYAQLLLRQGRSDEAEQHLQEHMRVRAATRPTGQVATGH